MTAPDRGPRFVWMKNRVYKYLWSLIIQLGFLIPALSAPITVTVKIRGSLVNTERWSDPSTCIISDRIICSPSEGVCFTLTYTYDDGNRVENKNVKFLHEGRQIEPVHFRLVQSNGDIINEGILDFYQEYVFPHLSGLSSIYEFEINSCATQN